MKDELDIQSFVLGAVAGYIVSQFVGPSASAPRMSRVPTQQELASLSPTQRLAAHVAGTLDAGGQALQQRVAQTVDGAVVDATSAWKRRIYNNIGISQPTVHHHVVDRSPPGEVIDVSFEE